MTYRIYTLAGVQDLFAATGMNTNLSRQWQSWEATTASTQSSRGLSNLSHNASEDQLVDLCTNDFLPSNPSPYNVINPPETSYQRLCNERPYPSRSWLKFEGMLVVVDNHATVAQISVGPDDLKKNPFNPANPSADIGELDATKNIQRFIESAPPETVFEWRGMHSAWATRSRCPTSWFSVM